MVQIPDLTPQSVLLPLGLLCLLQAGPQSHSVLELNCEQG